eukprot:1491334-Rhodomonas_salina.1
MGSGDTIFPVGHAWHGITDGTVADASLRVGGLTTALGGSVPSDLYSLQSGHDSDAWKKYIQGGQWQFRVVSREAGEEGARVLGDGVYHSPGGTSSACMHGVCKEAHVSVTRRVTCLSRALDATEVT